MTDPLTFTSQFETDSVCCFQGFLFGGKETDVTLEASNDMAGILIDRFGKDIFLIPKDRDHFRTTVTVAVSRQFLGWIFALGSGIRIVSPESVVEQMREEARRLADQYL